MPPKKATTRNKIAVIKLTESEVGLLREFLGGLEYKDDARTKSALYAQLRGKIEAGYNHFMKYT